jgi:hypothetical protein
MGLSKLSLHDLCSHVSEIKKIARPDHSEHALVFIHVSGKNNMKNGMDL